jgi:predicted acyl esterase
VDPSGRSWNLTQGYARFDHSNQTGPHRIEMRATAATVAAGHALRLSIAGAGFPAFPVNPGTGVPPWRAQAEDERAILITLRHGERAPSAVWLPIIPDDLISLS